MKREWSYTLEQCLVWRTMLAGDVLTIREIATRNGESIDRFTDPVKVLAGRGMLLRFGYCRPQRFKINNDADPIMVERITRAMDMMVNKEAEMAQRPMTPEIVIYITKIMGENPRTERDRAVTDAGAIVPVCSYYWGRDGEAGVPKSQQSFLVSMTGMSGAVRVQLEDGLLPQDKFGLLRDYCFENHIPTLLVGKGGVRDLDPEVPANAFL